MTLSLDFQKVKNWHSDGGGEAHRSGDRLFLHEIPQFGGFGHLVGEFEFNEEGIEALVKEANSWT